jgi:hypothetical protein
VVKKGVVKKGVVKKGVAEGVCKKLAGIKKARLSYPGEL